MVTLNNQKTKDIREKLGDSRTERWYKNVIIHIPYDMNKVFAPNVNYENINVFQANNSHDGKEMEALTETLDEHSLLIDCYICDDALMKEDICITTNRDWSRPTKFVLRLLIHCFKQYGYRVNLNRPFRFALAPDKHFIYNAIGLVVNDRLYGEKEKNSQLRNHLTSIYILLTKYWEKI